MSNVEELFNTDLLELSPKKAKIIALQCDCTGTKASGLAADLFKKYPHANCYKRKESDPPGTLNVSGGGGKRYIISMLAQLNPGEPKGKDDSSKKRLKWFQLCLEKISKFKKLRSIAFPYDIAGCDWNEYKKLIVDWANKQPKAKVYIVSKEEKDELGISDISDSESDDSELESGDEKNELPAKESDQSEDEDQSESEKSESDESSDEKSEDEKDSDEDAEDESESKESESEKEEPVEQNCTDTSDFHMFVWETIRENPLINSSLLETQYNENRKVLTKKSDYVSLSQTLNENTPKGWKKFFQSQQDVIDNISKKLEKEHKKGSTVFPPMTDVFTAFNLCPPKKIRVVIIGQDPYHTPGAATGLAFAHQPNVKKLQPSLKNIYQELEDDGFTAGSNGDLTRWAEQGVFLINTALTVRKGEANSHKEMWEEFTPELFNYLNEECKPMVVIAWGKQAESFARQFSNHKIIKSSHPSPYSADKGFFGSQPFTKTNKMLKKLGRDPIDWNL